MADKKPTSFLLYADSLGILDAMDDDKAGQLFKAIRLYHTGTEEEINDLIEGMDPLVKVGFMSLKSHFDRNREKYLKTCEVRREKGRLGGQKRAENARLAKEAKANETKQKLANASKSNQKQANQADNDNKNDNVNDNVNDKDLKRNTATGVALTAVTRQTSDTQEIFDYWVLVMGKDPKRTKLSTERRKKINDRLKDYSIGDIKQAIDGCRSNEYNMQNGYNDIELICRNSAKLESYRDRTNGNQQTLIKEPQSKAQSTYNQLKGIKLRAK